MNANAFLDMASNQYPLDVTSTMPEQFRGSSDTDVYIRQDLPTTNPDPAPDKSKDSPRPVKKLEPICP
jgi:hypothetical protein